MEKGQTDETKLYVSRDNFLINFYSPKHKASIRFNFKTKQMERENVKTKEWEYVEQQYRFLLGFTINSLEFEDDSFKKLLLASRSTNSTCKSLSSFISRLENILIYEGYIIEGIRYKINRNWNRGDWGQNGHYVEQPFKHPLHDYDKAIIKFFRDVDFEVTNDFEDRYFDNPSKYISIISILNSMDLENEEKRNILYRIMDRYSGEQFSQLTGEYGYEPKALIRYLIDYLAKFENVNMTDGLELLRDYYRMANQIGRNVKKYPKYLKSMHDIIQSNHNAYEREYPEEIFLGMMKKELEYITKKGNFIIINPTCSKDIISEGTSLNHCVSSYVDSILKGKTYIYFLRSRLSPDVSLVTLEMKDNQITQARGSYNRALIKDETEFLEKYCKKMKMELAI